MKRLADFFVSLRLLVFFVGIASCQILQIEEVLAQDIVGEIREVKDIKTSKPYKAAAVAGAIAWSRTVEAPGAKFIKLHFTDFQIGENDNKKLQLKASPRVVHKRSSSQNMPIWEHKRSTSVILS